VEDETLWLKQIGLSFEAIAEQITRVGLGQAAPLIALPANVTFPPDDKISRQACHIRFRKAIAREPSLAVEEFRKIDNARTEQMFLALQSAIRRGDVRAIETGIKLLEHSLKVNGYGAEERVNVEPAARGIPIAFVREAIALLDAEDAMVVQSTSAGPDVLTPAVSPTPAPDVASSSGDSLGRDEETFAPSFQIDLSTPEGMRVLEELRKESDDETNE